MSCDAVRAPTDREQLERFLRALGESVRSPLRLYLVGGSVLVDLGLRQATLDIDYVARADGPQGLAELERQIPRLKEQLNVNVEPAGPADFMPVPRGALDQSRYVRSYGPVAVYHYHYPSLILSKAARSAERDLADVELLLREGVVDWAAVEAAWAEVRASETGWLRHTPAEVERRLESLRGRLRAAGLIAADPATEGAGPAVGRA